MSCSRGAGAVCATSLRSRLSLASPCLRAAHPSHASCTTAVSDTVQHPERGCLDWFQAQQVVARSQRNHLVRTCIAPATVSFARCLRRVLWCSVTALPHVIRRLWEEGIASRRCIWVVRGREGYVQGLLGLLGLRRLLWLRRRRIGRVRVGSRRLVVWVMDQMAIWWARERWCRLLAGVHGACKPAWLI